MPERPARIELPAPALSLSVGVTHACAVLEDASLWCCGSNQGGELGDGTRVYRSSPVPVLAE